MKQIFAQFFENVETVEIVIATGLAVGDDIPDWESYELLNP